MTECFFPNLKAEYDNLAQLKPSLTIAVEFIGIFWYLDLVDGNLGPEAKQRLVLSK